MTLARCHDPDTGERRLLILDDEELVGIMIETIGRLAGYATRVTTTPRACVDEALAWQPQLVVIDLTLPTMTGEDVLRALGAAGCDARVIVSSGADEARLEAALQLGRDLGLRMAGILPKPFGTAALRALLGVTA
jgi:CheY-like chemotaxis protein